MVERRTVENIPATPHFSFLYGSFRLSSWAVPFFTTTVTVEEAAHHLHLTSDIPGAEEINWRLDELYQRDLNWPRVENQIVPYLRRRDDPQFFNSITVALLPYDRSSRDVLSSFHAEGQWSPPRLEESQRFAKTMELGPLTFGFWEAWDTVGDVAFRSGEFRWNTTQVFGVAIDGQHRLAAIKSYVGEHPTQQSTETRIPVIFLIFDEAVGYEAPGDRSVVEVLRRLFIDLNKHAQTVSRARQILLDDQDPHSVCVRKLVGEELRPDLQELDQVPPRLPLSLVDWHREQARFDDGPYVTTVLGLDWAVSEILSTKPIKDWTDYQSIGKQLDRIGKQLDVDLQPAKGRLKEIEEVSVSPFSYSEEELEIIQQGLAHVWAQPLCRLFTSLKPYDDLIRLRTMHDAFSLEFLHWYRLRERARDDRYAGRATHEYRQFLGRLSERQENRVGEPALERRLEQIGSLKSGNLAFNVVFQRALLLGFLEYGKIAYRDVEQLIDEYSGELEFPDFGLAWDYEGEAEEEDESEDESLPGERRDEAVPQYDRSLASRMDLRSQEFIQALNRTLEARPGLLDVHDSFSDEEGFTRQFWQGTLRTPEGNIDFTQAASKRASELLFMCAGVHLYLSSLGEHAGDFDEFWAECMAERPVPVCQRIGRSIDRFCSTTGARILSARDEDYDEGRAREEAYFRLELLWSGLKPAT